MRGHYDNSHLNAIMGWEWPKYHSVEDRAEAVRQLAIDWTNLFQNLASQAGEITADPTSSSGYRYQTQRDWDANPPDPKKVTWFKTYARPIFDAWVSFKSRHLGGSYRAWTERFLTNWSVYENWKNKLDALSAEAWKEGFSHPSVGAWPDGYIGQEASIPSREALPTDLRAALTRRYFEVQRFQHPGQVVAYPSPLELADFALETVLFLYGEDARLSGPQIVSRVKQTLARVRQ